MRGFDLRTFRITANSDIVNPNGPIYNPRGSVNTSLGDDQIIGNDSLTGDFAIEAFVQTAAKNLGAISSLNLSQQASVSVNGIINQGIINTSFGNDIISGTARANISVNLQAVSQVIAYANLVNTGVISNLFASLNVNATSNGIDNSKGFIFTGPGNDGVTGDNVASVSAVAVAGIDATAIVEAIVRSPLSPGLTAFASAMTTSIAKANVTATGIKNVEGYIYTQEDNDTIRASATSSAVTVSAASVASFATASPGNQALALAVANATAAVIDQAIGIDNTRGFIDTGAGNDSLQVTAIAQDKAIGILNTGGRILTGLENDQIIATSVGAESWGILGGTINTHSGNDQIVAIATGAKSWGIFGSNIDTGLGDDFIFASSFGGGVNINTQDGNDFVRGFGDARINGAWGYDTLSLGSFNRTDFHITVGADAWGKTVTFQRDGMTLTASGFEQINFANDTSFWHI